MTGEAATRMTLMSKKGQIKLASDGVSLLEGKREALLKELIDRAKQLRSLRNELHTRGRRATMALALARATTGTPAVRSLAVAGQRDLNLRVETERVWGMDLGKIDATNIVRAPVERGVGLLDMPSQAMEAAESAERMVEQLVQCAPLERNLQILGEEVKKTNRRINALNEYLLPKLRGEVGLIKRVLEEREREDTFRLKKIKQKKSAQKAAEAEAEAKKRA